MDFQAIQDRLVLAALPHAAFDGWSAATLDAACADEGLDPTMAERAFMGGVVDAVVHLSDLADRLMLADLLAMDGEGGAFTGLRQSEKVFIAIKTRLNRWTPHREAMRRAIGMLALPTNAAAGARAGLATVDAIWAAAGEASHDFSWYTRRASLGALYSTTVLYWLDDSSEDCADTWDFLQRRLNGLRRLPQLRQTVQGMLNRFIPGGFGAAR